MNTKGIFQKLITVIGNVFIAAVTVFLLVIPVLLFLINQGWQHPIQSLQTKAEMQSYMEEVYAGQELHVGFPIYNMAGDEFLAFVKDDEGQTLFGLSYAANRGIEEHKVIRKSDGHYYLETA